MFSRDLLVVLFACTAITSVGTKAADPIQASATSAPSAYTTADTTIGTLLDDPAAKAVLDKHVPQLTADPQFAMARSMTLKQIQSYAGDLISDEVLAKIDADLAKLSEKK